jgi:hypothetical protein
MKDDERINFKQLKITRRIGYGNKIKDADARDSRVSLGSSDPSEAVYGAGAYDWLQKIK